MTLDDFYEHLTLGELKQVAVGGFADYGQVQSQDRKELVQHVNLGLMQLYTRLNLREKEMVIHTRTGRELYPIERRYVKSEGYPDWFIDDTNCPFTDDILGIASVWVGGRELPLNDEHAKDSVYLPSYKCIQAPWASGSETMLVLYRAEPEKMTGDLAQAIPLPDVLLEALMSYVEFRVRKSMGGETHVAMAMAARQQYESLVQAVEGKSILNTAEKTTCIKPALGGWR